MARKCDTALLFTKHMGMKGVKETDVQGGRQE